MLTVLPPLEWSEVSKSLKLMNTLEAIWQKRPNR